VAVAHFFFVRAVRIHVVLAILTILRASSYAGAPDVISVADALRNDLLITAPAPVYPYKVWIGRGTNISGLFELKFDYDSGHLRELHVVNSTANDILDRHIIAALKLWKAKPHSIHILRVPVTFLPPH